MCCYLCRARPQRPQAECCVTHIRQTWKCCSLPSLTEGKSTQRARLFHRGCSSCARPPTKYRAPKCFTKNEEASNDLFQTRQSALKTKPLGSCFDFGNISGARGQCFCYVAINRTPEYKLAVGLLIFSSSGSIFFGILFDNFFNICQSPQSFQDITNWESQTWWKCYRKVTGIQQTHTQIFQSGPKPDWATGQEPIRVFVCNGRNPSCSSLMIQFN